MYKKIIAIVCLICGVTLSGCATHTGEVLTKHYNFNNCIYWNCSDAGVFATLPEGFVLAGEILGVGSADAPQTLKDSYSSFGEIGAKIYANSSNPYSTFLYDKQEEAFLLFVSQDLRNQHIMINGTLYTNDKGVSNYFSEQPWKSGECTCVGEAGEYVTFELPDQDFQTNMENAKEIYVCADRSVVYVVCEQSDNVTYVKLERAEKE